MAGTNETDSEKATQNRTPANEPPKGDPPQSHAHTNGPGMTNGVPDAANDAQATGTPEGGRQDSETAGGGNG